MPAIFVVSEGCTILITEDLFSKDNVVLLIVTDDPGRDLSPIILPKAALAALLGVPNAPR